MPSAATSTNSVSAASTHPLSSSVAVTKQTFIQLHLASSEFVPFLFLLYLNSSVLYQRTQNEIKTISLEIYIILQDQKYMKPSGRTMALGSTQPLTEMSTRNISWE